MRGSLLREFRPDVVHTHLRRAARIAAQNPSAAPTVATLHIRVNGPHFLELDGLICNAHWQVREIPPTYRGRVFKLNQLFTPHRRLTPTEIATLREEVGVALHEFLVGCVARLARSKGLDTLIDAFAAAQLPDAKLVIFGEGRERKRLERRLGPHAQLAGFRRNVKDYYQAFDLFVCPSRREPLPLVMLEAFDAGVPIVASTADGCRELIEEYTGDLFPVEDVGALAALLRRHHAERPGRRRVDLSPHYIENVNATILDCYAALIAARQAR